MKFSRLALLATVLAPAFSIAASTTPLLTKSNYPGFVPPWAIRSESCQIFADHVAIIRSYGYQQSGNGLSVTETRPLAISGDLRQVIAAAEKETTTQQDNGLCDGPGTSVVASLSDDANAKTLMLYTNGGCGSPKIERQGNASRALRDLVDQYCPTTHGTSISGN